MRNLTVAAIRKEKAAYISCRERTSDKKQMWNALKTLSINTKTNYTIPDELKKPNEINNYFISVFNPLNN